MPKISAPTLRAHRAETIDRLLEAWGELVLTRGYDAVSLAEVAAKAGLARTAIYNYFPDRESLLFAWTEREVQRSLSELEQKIAAADTCAEKLRVFVRLQLESFRHRHVPPGQEVIRFLRPETFERLMQHVEPLEKICNGILTEGAETGEFPDLDVDATVPMILACVDAERVPLATKAHDVDEATERVTTFLLRALTAAEVPQKQSLAPSRSSTRKPPAKKRKRAST